MLLGWLEEWHDMINWQKEIHLKIMGGQFHFEILDKWFTIGRYENAIDLQP